MQNNMQDSKTFYDQALSNQGLPLLLVYNKIHKDLRSSKKKHKFLVYGRKSSNKISTNKKIFTTHFYAIFLFLWKCMKFVRLANDCLVFLEFHCRL